MDFDTFYRREFASMVALARAVCTDRGAAEDIAQEAMARAHEQWATLASYDKPGAWLRRVTINLAISRSRSKRRELLMFQRKALERPLVADDQDDDDRIWRAVRALPARQRSVIALFYQEDRTTREIAEILDCSVSAATSHLSEARKRLARNLGASHDANDASQSPAASPVAHLGGQQ